MRLFTAVELPTVLRRSTAEAAARLLRGIPDVRRVVEANLHVTVCFLGEVEGGHVPEIESVLRAAAATLPEGAAALRPAWGAFPKPERPRVVFRAMDDPDGTLTSLEAAASTALAPLGFAPEKRAFTPHVTVARLRSPRAGRRVAEALATSTNTAANAEGFRVTELALVESVLSPAGPHYTVRARYPLRSGD